MAGGWVSSAYVFAGWRRRGLPLTVQEYVGALGFVPGVDVELMTAGPPPPLL